MERENEGEGNAASIRYRRKLERDSGSIFERETHTQEMTTSSKKGKIEEEE